MCANKTKIDEFFLQLLRLTHSCQMDYFMGLERVSSVAVYGGQKTDILICVLKMNEALTGLERHEG